LFKFVELILKLGDTEGNLTLTGDL
jgi:hypothetical protein